MDDLLKDAIADAKAVRETALANAKAALEEAFTPKIKSMLSAKLTEELDEELEEVNEMEDMEEMEEEVYEGKAEEDVMEEEISLDEILAELELDEAGETIVSEDESLEEAKDEMEEEMEESVNESEKEDLDEEIDLTELLASLNEEEDLEEVANPDAAAAGLENIMKGIKKLVSKVKDADIKKELQDLANAAGSATKGMAKEDVSLEEVETLSVELDEVKAELEEAYKVVEFQKTKLTEVNVLNSKLLYFNKLLRAHNLTEDQKVKVLETLDAVETKREAQIAYNTLNETFTMVKEQIKESIKKPMSTASKSVGVIQENKNTIVKEDNDVARWKKLANIK